MRRPVEFETYPPSLAARAPFGAYRAVVRHIVDGDTLDVLVDLGLNAYKYDTVRLRGVDAPERHQPAGRAAQEFLHRLLPIGTPVVIRPYKDAVTFGRYVCDVTFQYAGVEFDLATHLVSTGHARESVR